MRTWRGSALGHHIGERRGGEFDEHFGREARVRAPTVFSAYGNGQPHRFAHGGLRGRG